METASTSLNAVSERVKYDFEKALAWRMNSRQHLPSRPAATGIVGGGKTRVEETPRWYYNTEQWSEIVRSIIPSLSQVQFGISHLTRASRNQNDFTTETQRTLSLCLIFLRALRVSVVHFLPQKARSLLFRYCRVYPKFIPSQNLGYFVQTYHIKGGNINGPATRRRTPYDP
jgi:hypothetical protein